MLITAFERQGEFECGCWVLALRGLALRVLAAGSVAQVVSNGLGYSITYCTQHICQSVFPHTATVTAEVGATAALLRGAAAPSEVSNLAPVQ